MKTISLFASFLLPLSVLAETNVSVLTDIDCNTQVEALHTDPYHTLSTLKLTHAEKEKLQKFYKKLAGNWKGRQSDEICLGKGERSRSEVSYYLLKDVEAQFRHDGLFTFRSEKHRIENPDAPGHARTISMKPNNRVDYYPADELQKLEFLDDNTVVMTKRYRRANAVFIDSGLMPFVADDIRITPEDHDLPGNGFYQTEIQEEGDVEKLTRGTSFRERQDTLFLAEDTLMIKTSWYINGYYSGSEITQLFRQH